MVGTHRLVQKDVKFKDLGLCIIDEEQRFGVTHKEKLRERVRQVDTLTLSATPIPRTLNMALSGIRDMSTLEEPPADRQPVQTYVMEHEWPAVAEAIRRELNRGGQVYYLHNRVENIESTAGRLRQWLGEDVRLAMAHGKMSEQELSRVMQQMADGEVQVLVCTTIIETGIDIPNVNTLIIEDADRLGLAQLHQRSNVAVLHAGGGSGQGWGCRGHGAGELGVDAVGRDVQQDVHGGGGSPQQAALFHAQRQNGGIGGSVVSFQPEVEVALLSVLRLHLFDLFQVQLEVAHGLQTGGGIIHAQQASQLGLVDVAPQIPFRDQHTGQRIVVGDAAAQGAVKLPGIVQRLVLADVQAGEGLAAAAGLRVQLQLQGFRRILAVHPAGGAAELRQHLI